MSQQPDSEEEAARASRSDAIAESLASYSARVLPVSVHIPEISGEMQLLRPVRLEDLEVMDELNAWSNSTTITGLSAEDERETVGAWVRDSVAWTMGSADLGADIASRGGERTIGWTMQTKVSGSLTPEKVRPFGMIFLTAVNAWNRSARVQVILGKDFRGRGYSRDAMPRVMTFGFASVESGEGLGLHRIITCVPEKNTRANSVYRSLGFTPEVELRDALWDDDEERYQGLTVLSTLQDEYDPVRSLDAFGMHMIPGNPGTQEAMAAHQHSIAIAQNPNLGEVAAQGADEEDGDRASSGVDSDGVNASETQKAPNRRHSKRAWWRRFGPSRSREAKESQRANEAEDDERRRRRESRRKEEKRTAQSRGDSEAYRARREGQARERSGRPQGIQQERGVVR